MIVFPRGFRLGAQNGQEAVPREVKIMKHLFRRSLCLLLVPIWATPTIAEMPSSDNESVPNLRITVLVHNVAKVAEPVLAEAETEANQIFSNAGVDLKWMECPCSQNAGPTDLMLGIIPRLFGSMKSNFGDGDLGFAPSSEEGGVLATIFFHRIGALSRGGSAAPILGNAIAHELGHLLLGPKAHSPTGIMTPHWSRSFPNASPDSLQFTPDQAERLRTHVSTLMKRQEFLRPSLMAMANGRVRGQRTPWRYELARYL